MLIDNSDVDRFGVYCKVSSAEPAGMPVTFKQENQ